MNWLRTKMMTPQGWIVSTAYMVVVGWILASLAVLAIVKTVALFFA